ncbi:MAG TPA: SidJ-related pseudokinase [Desulfotignum sp.]|nr:SidJ-related pseudokinase [Desulfotignum sp.]
MKKNHLDSTASQAENGISEKSLSRYAIRSHCHGQGDLYRTQALINRGIKDFSGAYMAVKYVAGHMDKYPDTIGADTVNTLTGVIRSPRFEHQKQSYFLFHEAAGALSRLAGRIRKPLSESIILELNDILYTSHEKRLRAVNQALGDLPWKPAASAPSLSDTMSVLSVDLNRLLPGSAAVLKQTRWQGRSLIITTSGSACLVLKFATSADNITDLAREAAWLTRLQSPRKDLAASGFDTPVPIEHKGHLVFNITSDLPRDTPPFLYKQICIAFSPCPGYYEYPNDPGCPHPMSWTRKVFIKNARILGQMTVKGIVHTALIPLFHNRVQQRRRNDQGAYLWEHAGRLDQWLDSCQYPNFARSGPRDFEHLERIDNGAGLRHYIGEHLLSFILVIGSFFRNKAPDRRGMTPDVTPEDTRDLFDRTAFESMIADVSGNYFKGLCKRDLPHELLQTIPRLTCALIQTMGYDEHMMEVLRIQDQNRMTKEQYQRFLHQRGVKTVPPKGQTDIPLSTGPHLGGFNQSISVPELIEYLFRFSALAVSHCFLNGNRPLSNAGKAGSIEGYGM